MGKNSVECAVSVVHITPPRGTSMQGYFSDRKAKGVYDDLYAKIIAIRKDTSQVIIIACDLIGVPSEFTLPIREAISKQTGVPICSIMISATHTHTGPVMSGNLVNQSYLNNISERIIKETVAVNQKLKNCLVEYGSGQLKGYAFNRRYFMKNGKVLTNPGINNPDVLKPAAGVDYSINIIKMIDSENELKAIVVNCTNHCDTISGNKISADWPGYLSSYVKETLGADITVLVLNGPEGDINHFDVFGKRGVQNIEEAKRLGKGYAKKVIDVCKHTKPLEIETIRGVCEIARVPVRKIRETDIIKAKKTIKEFKSKPKIKRNRPLESQAIAQGNEEVMVYFAKNLLCVAEKHKASCEYLELQAIKLGELVLIGVGGELFTEIGLNIKRNNIFRHTIIVGLANGCNGYLPTKRAFKEGGYETMPTEKNKMSENVEEIIVTTINKLLKKV